MILSEGKLVAVGTPGELGDRLSGHRVLRATAIGSGEVIRTAVGSVPGVQDVTIEKEENGEVTFTAQSREDEDLRAAVSKALAAADCTLLALSAESKSLEDVFLALTNDSSESHTNTKKQEE